MNDNQLSEILKSIVNVFTELKPWLELQTAQNNIMKNRIEDLEERVNKLEKEGAQLSEKTIL